MSTQHIPGMRSLWREGMRCGLHNLLRPGNRTALRHALRLLLCPVDLWRYAEFDAVLTAYRGERLVLDIGSPKLLARVLARRFGTKVIAGDIVQHIGREVAVYARATRSGALIPCVFDARNLPFAGNSVPLICSLSVIEHIGGDGDRSALREMGRVLAPGGIAILTVPVSRAFHEIWLDRDPYGSQPRNGARVFFSYVYDRKSLHQRLIEPSGLTLVSMDLWTDEPPGWYESRYLPALASNPIRAAVTKLRDFRLARTHIRRLPEGDDCTGRGVAALVFRKQP